MVGTRNLRPQNIVFRNLDFEVEGSGECPQSVPEIEPGSKFMGMWHSIFPAYGFYLRHVDNVKFETVFVHELQPGRRKAFRADDCKDVVLTGGNLKR